ncbi:MAG: TIGR00266 family protein, partial [Actinomycetales bacterium]
KGSWLANAAGVQMDTAWGGAKNLFGGEGGFVANMTGNGPVVIASYGALDLHELKPGESFTVDSGHLVAYDNTISLQTRTVAGLMTSMKSGEGIVVDMTGPGRVWTQSRNPGALIEWLTTVLPFTRS